MHAHAGNRRVQRDKFAELLRRSMMTYVDPESGQHRPLSQRYLARNVIDVNEQTISRWARQETAPSPEMVEKVADFFGWSDEDLEVVYGLAHGEELFEDWRIAVGLARGFPKLSPLLHPWARLNALGQPQATPDSRRFYLSEDQQEAAREVYESLGLSRVIVRTAPGHGATTLARWVHDRAVEDAISRRMIPVLVSLEQVVDAGYEELADAERRFLIEMHGHEALGRRRFDEGEGRIEALTENADERATAYFGHIGPDLCAEAIEARIRFAVVHSLATQPWEMVLPRPQLAGVLGATGTAPTAIEARRNELAVAFDRISPDVIPPAGFWDGLSAIAPSLGRESLSAILRRLHDDARVRPALILDLSATPMGRQYLGRERGEYLTEPYRKVLGHVSKALEGIEQDLLGGPKPSETPPIDTTFLLSAAASSALPEELQGQAIDFPSTEATDLFAILANHYPPESQQHTGGRVEVLAAVLDSEFLELNERTAISTEMVLLEQQLKYELSSREGIAYHLRRSHAGGRRSAEPEPAGSSEALIEVVLAKVRAEIPEMVRAEVERRLSSPEPTERKE